MIVLPGGILLISDNKLTYSNTSWLLHLALVGHRRSFLGGFFGITKVVTLDRLQILEKAARKAAAVANQGKAK